MKQALVIVSFGTSVPAARKSIDAVTRAMAACMPEADLFLALTSPTIRRKLRARGEQAFSLEEILEALAGYDRVVVQPTHLLYGIEYDRIRETVAAFARRLPGLVLGTPLLAGTEDLQALAGILLEAHPRSGEAMVLMGHGTEHFANLVYPAFQTVLRLRGCSDVYVGTVEGWPGIGDVIDQLKADGVKKALLVPMMLVAGDHACNDMAGLEPDSWKNQLEAQGIAVRCHLEGLGSLEAVQALYCRHLRML